MLRLIGAYVGALVVFVALDFGWLSFATGKLYRPILGDLLAAKVNLPPGAVFYLLYIAGVLFLATWPALRDGAWSRAALNGAVLGLVAYGTYDLTNHATLRSWSIKLTLADMAWGTFGTAVAATVAFFIARAIKSPAA